MALNTIGRMKIEGLREVEHSLKELPKATQGNVIKRAMTKAAEPMREAAENFAPVRTGRLKGNIVVSARAVNNVGKAEFASAMRAGKGIDAARAALREARRNSDKKSHIELFMGPTREIWYAHFPEFGTKKMSAKPFMRPAFDAYKEVVVSMVKDLLWAEIAKAAARLARKTARLAAKARK